ncbi:MAG: glucuronate isomerase [Acholeplasmataceae bacterium]|nr:glucuronate isomerase [Acholeplasmataceae bacterium]
MKSFVHDDFLLHSEIAKKLYHTYASKMPIIDYHCHLDPKEIYQNKKFRNLFDVWLTGDHYKWRLMRANGVTEDLITGQNTSDIDKFRKWAETVPLLLGNPLYHWTHFELKRYFDIDTLLSLKTADQIYHHANEMLKKMSVRDMISKSNVETICTTDDPIDSLEWHEKLANDSTFNAKVIPAFRPDKAVNIDISWFNDWILDLSKVTGYPIRDLSSLKRALKERVEYFHNHGCRLSDHALDVILYTESTEEEVNQIFIKALNLESLTRVDIKKYKGYLMVYLGQLYHTYGWVQQYHIGALRNVSSRMFHALGPDTGFDAINDGSIAEPLQKLLDALDATGQLPKTIIYTLNPRDFEVAITLMQAFQGDGIPGKIQFGSSWWFLDTIEGMTKQIKALSNNGLLARFVGMLTDSRSFLSYSRHEYFRRLICDIIGDEVRLGYFPEDYELLGKMVQDIAYGNAKHYFNF